jgi:hypothetical protein
MLLSLPSLALECFAHELKGTSFWMVPYHLVVAGFKAAWGSACMPATLVFGNAEVRATQSVPDLAWMILLVPVPEVHVLGS